MTGKQRAIVRGLVAVAAAVVLSGCIPRLPPEDPAAIPSSGRPRPQAALWQAGAGCKWGAKTTAGNAARGVVRLETELCWDDRGHNLFVRGLRYECVPGSGWARGAAQGVKDASSKWSAYAVCTFARGSTVYEVVYRHSWATSDKVYLYRQGCSADNSSAVTTCGKADPLLWLTWGFEDEWLDARPPAPPPADRWLQGARVPSTDPVARSAQVTVNGSPVQTSNADGSFRHVLPKDYPKTYTAKVSVPAGYTVAWTACSNNTSCHGDKTPTPGDTVTANPEPGKFLDVRWYFTKLGTIQGFMIHGNTRSPYGPNIAAQRVYIDDVAVPDAEDTPYVRSVAPGWHHVRVTWPAGWYVGYTLCYDRTDCHTGSVHEWSAGVWVDVPAGGFADLWWHYYVCSVPASCPGSPY